MATGNQCRDLFSNNNISIFDSLDNDKFTANQNKLWSVIFRNDKIAVEEINFEKFLIIREESLRYIEIKSIGLIDKMNNLFGKYLTVPSEMKLFFDELGLFAYRPPFPSVAFTQHEAIVISPVERWAHGYDQSKKINHFLDLTSQRHRQIPLEILSHEYGHSIFQRNCKYAYLSEAQPYNELFADVVSYITFRRDVIGEQYARVVKYLDQLVPLTEVKVDDSRRTFYLARSFNKKHSFSTADLDPMKSEHATFYITRQWLGTYRKIHVDVEGRIS